MAEEALFLIAFLAFVLVRAANPDLWHPYLGGEKPMDFAYLNAVLRSTTMPPLDPWFAGGALNYYYYGQFMVATVIRVTGIPSAVAYNLAVPLFFALTAGAAFSLGYNITEGARRWLRSAIRPPRWSAIAAGGAAVAMTVVLGNLHGGGQLLRGAVSNFDFWAPTRMMPPDPPGFEITEFPFFTFLFADLHAHLMAMPLALLAVGLCLNTVLLSRRGVAPWRFALSFALLALTAGAMAITNTWDFPTYVGLGAVSIALGQWLASRSLSRALAYRTAGLLLLFAMLALAFWLPFHLRLENGFPGLGVAPVTTPLGQYLAIHGLFLYVLLTLLAVEALPRIWRWALRREGPWQLVLGFVVGVLVTFVIALTVFGLGVVAMMTVALLALLVLLLGWVFLRRWHWGGTPVWAKGAAPFNLLPLGLLALALAIGVGVDLVVMNGRHRSAEHRVQALPAGVVVLCARRIIRAVAFGLRARLVHPPSTAPGPLDSGPHPACGRFRRLPGIGHRSATGQQVRDDAIDAGRHGLHGERRLLRPDRDATEVGPGRHQLAAGQPRRNARCARRQDAAVSMG